MANGLISMQHRQTPAEARALIPKQSLKDQKKVNTESLISVIIFFFSFVCLSAFHLNFSHKLHIVSV